MVNTMGVTTQLWKPKQTSGLPVPRKAWDDFPMGAKNIFPGETSTLKRAPFRLVLGTNEGGFIREGSEKGALGRELH